MNFAKLYVSLNEKFEAVKFLQDRRYLLFKTRNCIHWNTEMTLYLGEKEDRFRCKNKKKDGVPIEVWLTVTCVSSSGDNKTKRKAYLKKYSII